MLNLAAAILARAVGIQRIDCEPMADQYGDEALRITTLVKRGNAGKITGGVVQTAVVAAAVLLVGRRGGGSDLRQHTRIRQRVQPLCRRHQPVPRV